MLIRPARPARNLLAGALVLLVLGLLGGLTAVPASAHARFLGSDPAEGSVVPTLPSAVVMTYSEEISPQFVDTAVIAPGADPVPTPASVSGTDVTIDLSEVAGGDVAPGAWQVVARVVSADGHPVEHSVQLQVEAAAAPTAEPSPAATDGPAAEPTPASTGEPTEQAEQTPGQTPGQSPAQSAVPISGDPLSGSGLPRWVSVLVAVALVAAGVAAVVLKLRSRPPGD